MSQRVPPMDVLDLNSFGIGFVEGALLGAVPGQNLNVGGLSIADRVCHLFMTNGAPSAGF